MALINVVKYNGTDDVLAWKYPSEALSTKTQLIVNESQEAVLFKGGRALDVFSSGRYTLDTENIPILNSIINLPFGGVSPFTAEVWFVNKASMLDVKWGTATPVQIQDAKYSVFVPIRAFGQFGIRVIDSKKFLAKLVGTVQIFDKTNIVKYFRGVYLTKVKDSISSYILRKNISVVEINAYIDELSEHAMDRIAPVLDEYGIELVNFYINDISVPEDDSTVKKLKDALAKKAEMDIIGYDYTQERTFDTLEGAAKNNGAMGGIMGAGIGLGFGANIGNTIGNMASDVMSTNGYITCPNCSSKIKGGTKFCPECGNAIVNSTQNNNTNTKFCPHCGAKVQVGFRFCPECGGNIQ